MLLQLMCVAVVFVDVGWCVVVVCWLCVCCCWRLSSLLVGVEVECCCLKLFVVCCRRRGCLMACVVVAYCDDMS